MRVLHPGLHRRGGGLPRRLAGRARRRDPFPRGDRPRAFGPSLPLRGLRQHLSRRRRRLQRQVRRRRRTFAARRSAAEGDRRSGLYRRYSPRGPARRRGPALAARSRADRRDRSRTRARHSRRRRRRVRRRRRPHGPLRRRGGRRGRGGRSQDGAGGAGGDQGRLRDFAGRDRAGRRAQSRSADPVPEGQGAEVQRRRRRRCASVVVRQCPRTDRGILAQEEVGARVDRRRQGGRRPVAVRGDVPDRRPAAHLPRAPCGGRPLRRRRTHGTCLDPGGGRAQNQDREVVQARSRKGSGRGRAHRRRLRLQGHAWRRDGDRDQARPGGQGAGQGRLRPARGTVGGGLPAGGGGQGRDSAGTRRRSQGAVADRPFRRRA